VLLGVTPATPRGWDRDGKRKAVRHPVNRYRMYPYQDVVMLQRRTSLFPIEPFLPGPGKEADQANPLTAPGLRRLVKVLHRTLRDSEGNSSLIERFDELTKLLYCKVLAEREGGPGGGEAAFSVRPGEPDRQVAARLHAFLASLVRQRPALFPARFTTLRLSDATLRRVAEALAPVRVFAPQEDLKGLAYEEVIRNTFDKGDNQQFFTPRPIVEFMVHLLGGSLAGCVCDPACGTGGFLLYADRYLRQRGRRSRPLLLGFEVDKRLAWVAGINLDMHEVSRFDVRHVNGAGSLGPHLRPYFGRVDAIVTNPPFGSDLSDEDALGEFELGKGRTARRRGVLFLERCLDLLKPGGLLAIILDDGVLNSPSNTDTRRLLIERSHPFAIVSLPETAFMPYASVKASVLFLQKKGGRTAPVVHERGTFFAHAEVVGRKPNGDPLFRVNKATGRMELDSDLPEILGEWSGAGPAAPARRPGTSGRVFWAPIPDIDDSAFAKDGYRLDLAYHHPSRHEALRALHSSPYPLRSLLEVCDLRNEAVVPSRDLQDEELTYLGLANIEASTGACAPVVVSGSSLKSAVKRFVGGDILFAKMRPELRKVCLIPEEIDEGFASAECLVLVPRLDERTGEALILPELLSILLRSDLVYGQIVHLVIGIGRPRLSKTAVLNVRLPCPPPRDQRRLLESYRRSERASRALIAEGEKASERARQILMEARKHLVDNLLGSRNGG
jgi:type I restriction enzyme M protein